MVGHVRARVAGLYRSLTRAGEEQPLHRMALAVVLLLDAFILVSVFDGLDVHTRQLAPPEERIPPLCRAIVIDGTWSPERRLDELAATVASRRSAYRDPAEREPEVVPACARVLGPIAALSGHEELGPLLERRHRLSSELRDAQTALTREKGAYDTQLLKALATAGADTPDTEAIVAAVERRTAAIEAGRVRIREIDVRVERSTEADGLRRAIDAVDEAARAALAADLRAEERWHPVRRLGMQLAFLLPLVIVFATWHGASARRGRGVQALVTAHLAVIAAVPLLLRIAEAAYDVIPKRLLKRFIDLLVSLKLVALWHYLVIALAVAAGLALVFAVQRWMFSQERLVERRIAKDQCQRCGKRLPPRARACPFCGYGQRRSCASCGGATPMHAPYCIECGAPAARTG